MSTRAMYTFIDDCGSFNVYKHCDGYPSGAYGAILNALKDAWTLPRFEADEFSAAFVSANKDCGGGVRLMPTGPWKKVAPGDIEYRYEISMKNDALWIVAYSTQCWDDKPKQSKIFEGTLAQFDKFSQKSA